MRHSAGFALLAALAVATPVPQEINIDAIIAAGPPPPVSVPIGDGNSASVVDYDATAVVAGTYASVTAQPVSERRSLQARDDCDPQASGYGPAPTEDTPEAFVAYEEFSTIATGATTPNGYQKTFTNLKAASQSIAWLGYNTLRTYGTQSCADMCNQKDGCASFNIKFERDPLLIPGTACPKPDGTTVIRCDFWGSPITAEGATNSGQWRNDFHIVIAGSNGYVKTTPATVPGYTGYFAYDKAIQAPSDCNGRDTYIAYKQFNDGQPFDAARCAAACEAETQFNIDHLNSRSICRFFNTYIMYKNGQWRDNDHWTVGYSQVYSNDADPGSPICPADITYLQTPDNEQFCSAYISYQPPVTTTSVASTLTTVATTEVTSTTTVTAGNAATPAARVRRSVFVIGASETVQATGPLFEAVPTSTASNATSTGLRRRVALATPTSLANWPASKISAACSSVATGLSTRTIVTSTATEYTSTLTSTITVSVTTTPTPTPAANPQCFYLSTTQGSSTLWVTQQFVYLGPQAQRILFELGTDGHLYSNVVSNRRYQLGSYKYTSGSTGSVVGFQTASTWTTSGYEAPTCAIADGKLTCHRGGAPVELWAAPSSGSGNRLQMLSVLPSSYQYYDLRTVEAACPVYSS